MCVVSLKKEAMSLFYEFDVMLLNVRKHAVGNAVGCN